MFPNRLLIATLLLCALGAFAQKTRNADLFLPAAKGTPEIRFQYVLDAKGAAYQIAVLEDGKQVQTLQPCRAASFNPDKAMLDIHDFNFDGYNDLTFTDGNSRDPDKSSMCVYLFEPKTKRFVPNELLSSLRNVTSDPDAKTIVSSTSKEPGPGTTRTFKWNGDKLELIKEDRLAAIHGSACPYRRTISELKDGKMVVTSTQFLNTGMDTCHPTTIKKK